MNLSFWEYDAFLKDIDIVIIGSGIVGLTAALKIKTQQPKLKVVILERGSLPSGASTKNAGFACFGSASELLEDLEHHTEDEVLSLLEKRWKGLQRLTQHVGKSMGYLQHGNYEVFAQKDKALFETCAEQLNYLNKQIAPITGELETFSVQDGQLSQFGFKQIDHLIWNRSEGQIHTGRMMEALLEKAKDAGILILNGIEVKELEETSSQVTIHTQQGWNINCKAALIATNGFARHLLPDLQVKPARNQVLLTSPIPNLPIAGCFHYDKGYVYFRNIENRILIGGGRNLNIEGETTAEFGFTDQIQEHLQGLLKNYFLPNQDYTIEHKWSGIMGVADQKKPIVKHHSKRISIAVRMGGMGVAIGSLIGEEGAGLALENL
ncbi:MAG: FAD-binding oxidoreductase [Aureispira sp.]|nr:FAD-binding oxidoreductase [Aureispira sp.]